MANTRINQIAKEAKVSNKEVIAKLAELGIEVEDEKAEIDEEDAQLVLDLLKEENGETISIDGPLTVQNLADAVGKSVSEVIMELMKMGTMATINQEVTFEVASLLAQKYGFNLEVAGSDEDVEEELEKLMQIQEDKEEDLKPRPPVVTVMGHVDHGKTSLLDAIRNTRVTSSEAGGITQHIGASEVSINGQKIVFLDTPGHEAFTAMRARGAQVTDIVILVVAADDGIMPQTKEAINHCKAADVPMIVAINKIDRPGANVDRVKQELTEHGLVSEDWGGDTICVPVSAKTGENLESLLEMVLLTAEMQELKADPNRKAKGTVIEAKLDKGRGAVASLLIQNGTLNVGDSILVGSTYGRIRAMFDDRGKKIKSAGPSIPVEILGLSEVPAAGDRFIVCKDEKTARNMADLRKQKIKADSHQASNRVSLEDLYSQIQEGKVKELAIVVKADVQGSVEAIRQSLEKLSTDDVKVRVIHGAVGAITETDVTLAAASNALVIGFNVRPDGNATVQAEKENIEIKTYRIIYDAIEDVKSAMIGMLEPEYKEVVNGKAEVRMTYKISNVGTIAGCYVTDGKIVRNSEIRVIRDGIVIFESTLASLKRFKDDAKEVAKGYECGLSVEKFNDLKEGDVIESFTMEAIKRKEL